MRAFPSLFCATASGLAAAALALLPLAPVARAQTTISTAVTGPVYGNNNAVTVTSTGSVTALGVTPATWNAFQTTSGNTITQLFNQGTATARATALFNNQSIPVVFNLGTLTGNSGIEYYGGGTTVLMQNQGLISGTAFWGIRNTGTGSTITSLVNSGTISAASVGVRNESAGTITTLNNSKLISGSTVGVLNDNATITSLQNNAGGSISGIKTTGTIGTLSNNGSISGTATSPIGVHVAVDSPTNAYGLIDTISGTGSISGNNFGVKVDDNGKVGTFTNGGIVSNVRTDDLQYGGLLSEGLIGTLTNSGTFEGWGYGIDIRASVVTGTISNLASGVIRSNPLSTSDSAGALLIESDIDLLDNAGLITSNGYYGLGFQSQGMQAGNVVNSGTISAAVVGLGLTGDVYLTRLENQAAGTISAGGAGVVVGGRIQDIVNAGTIRNTLDVDGMGLLSAGGGYFDTLTNSGTIAGYAGIGFNQSLDNGSITNSGRIEGRISDGVWLLDSTLTQLSNAGVITAGANGVLVNTNSSITTLTNSGTVDGSSAGIANVASIGTITNDAGGTIQGNTGIESYGSIDAVTNSGLINGTGAWSVYNGAGGTLGTLTNSGTIQGDHGVGNFGTLGTITNNASGLIEGTASGIFVNGSIGQINNAGTVSGGNSDAGLETTAGSTITALTNSGTIQGFNGIDSSGTINTVTNSGRIEGANSGLKLVSSGTISNTATGVIIGTRALQLSGTTGLLSNAGRITGGFGTAIEIDGGTLLKFSNSGPIDTAFYNGVAIRVGPTGVLGDETGARGPAIESIGAGALVGGSIVNQGLIHHGFRIENQSVNVSADGGTGAFSSGELNVVNGDLTFTNGTFLLGSNVAVNGGAGTFTNQGILSLATSQTVTGGFTNDAAATVESVLFGPSSYGTLAITGHASFAGGLDLDTASHAFALADGQSFSLFSYASASGGFSSLLVDGVALVSAGANVWKYGSLWLTETVGLGALTLTVSSSTPVPEIDPAGMGSVLALVTGALGLVERRRIKSKAA